MKYKIIIDQELSEDIIIFSRERTQLVENIDALIQNENCEIIGYHRDEVVKLAPSEIYCFVINDNKVYAMTEREQFQIKQRLYQLEELFSNNFIKINQSCLVNENQIRKFETTIGGALMVALKNGYKDYISRRQLKAVKERIGF